MKCLFDNVVKQIRETIRNFGKESSKLSPQRRKQAVDFWYYPGAASMIDIF